MLRNFVEAGVALLLNQVCAVSDGLLNQLHYVGFGLVEVARRIVLVLAEVGAEGGAGNRAQQVVVYRGNV